MHLEWWRQIARRPVVWLLGIAGAVITAVVTQFFTETIKPIITSVSEYKCDYELRKSLTQVGNGELTILISPLANDPTHSQTDRVLSAFHGERGLNAVKICKTIFFDNSKILQVTEQETFKRAASLITKEHADLLLFGDVLIPDKSIEIWAVNEHGGCDDRHPKPTLLDVGVLPSEFSPETKLKLVSESLKEIAAACLNWDTIDWPLFAKRIQKLGTFIQQSTGTLPFQDRTVIAASYINAMWLLYMFDQGEEWFQKGTEFSLNELKQLPPSAPDELRGFWWKTYGQLLLEKAKKIHGPALTDSAIAAFNKAIALNPKDFESFNNRGNAYYNDSNYQNAFSDYDNAVLLAPDSAAVVYNRGRTYEKLGKIDNALQDYTRAIQLDPSYAKAFGRRGQLFDGKGDYDRAIQELDEAIRLSPTNAEFLINRGGAYFDKGDYDRAIADNDQAIRLDPKSTISWSNGCWYRAVAGQLEQALKDCNEGLRLAPSDIHLLSNRGFTYLKLGQFGNAITDFDSELRIHSNDSSALYMRGIAKQKTGDSEGGSADVAAAAAIRPNVAEALARYGIK